jgi:hypothetical protein
VEYDSLATILEQVADPKLFWKLDPNLDPAPHCSEKLDQIQGL